MTNRASTAEPERGTRPGRPRLSIWTFLGLMVLPLLFSLYHLLPNIGCDLSGNIARGDVNAITCAVDGFFSDYSQYPGTTHALDGNAGLIDELTATEKSVINTRKTVFLETETAMSGPAEDFLDPWGTPYRVYLDVGVAPDQKAYDGNIEVDLGGGIQTYLTRCIAISSGPNKSFGDADDVFYMKQF